MKWYTKLRFEFIRHREENFIFIFFEFDREIIANLKKIGAKWSNTYRTWYIPDSIENRNRFQINSELPTNKENPREFLFIEKALTSLHNQLILKAYSRSTIKTYTNEVKHFLIHCQTELSPAELNDKIKEYLLHSANITKVSEAALHSRINALKFYCEQVLYLEKVFWDIPRPKKRIQHPAFFNKDEITKIIQSIHNLKHKTMIMLIYSCGLRVSEVVTLKIADIDSERMSVFIRQSKGKKDRVAPLSPLVLIMLREYYKKYKPSEFLFEGQSKGQAYSVRSVQIILAEAKTKAGIRKAGSVHALRHSFATHLLDRGTDIHMIQKILGHNDIKTTLRYIHVTNKDMLKVISPIDDLNL